MTGRPRVLLDARKARDYGIGTYIRGLLGGLAALERYDLHALVLPGDEALVRGEVSATICAAGHYSLGELFAVRRAISKLRPDVFHAPHYVVPLLPAARDGRDHPRPHAPHAARARGAREAGVRALDGRARAAAVRARHRGVGMQRRRRFLLSDPSRAARSS